MKVLQLAKFYYPVMGGVETVAYDIAEILNEKGIVCDILCTNINGTTVYDNVNGYKVFRAGIIGDLFSTQISFKYIEILRDIIDEYDVLHVHLPNPLANLAIMCANVKRKKIVIHWHSDIIKQKNLLKIYRPMQSWLLKKADAIIGTSEQYIQNSKDLSEYQNKCIAVPIGIDPNRLNADANIIKIIKERYFGKKIILSLGRHVYYKGFKYLIESAQYLNDEYIILIGGEGPLTNELADSIVKNNFQTKVELLGKIDRDELGSYFSACDVFCLPSIMKSEAFGVVQIEAMSFAKPVIATNITGSGTSWVNKHDSSGLNVEIMDSQQIADAVKKITIDPLLYQRYSVDAKRRFDEYFHRDVMLAQIIDIYKSL
ncbi:glycosyltransferase [Lelliottia sp. JS-SCA-14]|uniref:glycosyltransferase n=1 Tax=Lelliottia sp. JS-SCA-14 TaxID=3110110 RepID=UPI002D794551|nr:glycosyltransferase [Lelliottia sp. JS-SCA-14]